VFGFDEQLRRQPRRATCAPALAIAGASRERQRTSGVRR
jgi:hypothetical protein